MRWVRHAHANFSGRTTHTHRTVSKLETWARSRPSRKQSSKRRSPRSEEACERALRNEDRRWINATNEYLTIFRIRASMRVISLIWKRSSLLRKCLRISTLYIRKRRFLRLRRSLISYMGTWSICQRWWHSLSGHFQTKTSFCESISRWRTSSIITKSKILPNTLDLGVWSITGLRIT